MNDGNTKEPMLVEDGAGKPSHAEDPEANDPKQGGRQKGEPLTPAGKARACCLGLRDWFRNSENLLVSLTVAAVVLGMVFGFILKASTNPSKRAVDLISFPGELFMNMLKMLIIPLIVSSLVSGLAALDAKSSGRMGSFAVLYYFMTTILAVILGIILVVIIHPGSKSIKEDLGPGTNEKKMPPTLDAFLDLFRNIFPPNLIQATIQQYQSYIVSVPIKRGNSSNITLDDDVNNASMSQMFEEVIKPRFIDHTNVLGLVTFSIAFGMIMSQMGEKALLMVQFFSILNEVVMRLVQVIMWASPAGIFFLVVGKILAIENLKKTAQALALYMLTVVMGLVIHACITLALLFFLVTRRNPLKYFKGLFQAWITALGTASSAATLPITFRCLEENNKVDARVTRFVLPIGATINMDGTALYEAVASIFIAQINGFPLHAGTIITISVTATLAAIGAASVPSAGLVTMILVLSSVGLPTTDITLIFAVDWLLDRLRTSVNVLGDAFGAGIVEHLCRAQLAEQDADTQRQVMDMIEEGRRPSSSKKRMSLAVAMRLTDDQPIGSLPEHTDDYAAERPSSSHFVEDSTV